METGLPQDLGVSMDTYRLIADAVAQGQRAALATDQGEFDQGLYVSTDMGGHWQKFMEGLPTVPVHDLKIHPRDRCST